MRILPLAIVAVLLAFAAPAAADPTVFASTTSATVVGAGNGWTVWSEKQGNSFVLMARGPIGITAPTRVAPRGVPFDVDVGKDAKGMPVAAYSRCKTEPVGSGGANTIGPQWTSGKGCTIRVLDLVSGRETKVKRSSADQSAVLPSVAGSTLAYVGVPKSKRLKKVARLRVYNYASKKTKLIDTGKRRKGSAGFAEGPTSLDTDGTRVASVWRAKDRSFNSFDTDMRVQKIRKGEPQHLAGASNTEDCNYETILSPTLSGGNVYFIDTTGSDWVLGSVPAKSQGAGASQTTTYGVSSIGSDSGPLPTAAAIDGTQLAFAATATRIGGSVTGITRVLGYELGSFGKSNPVQCV